MSKIQSCNACINKAGIFYMRISHYILFMMMIWYVLSRNSSSLSLACNTCDGEQKATVTMNLEWAVPFAMVTRILWGLNRRLLYFKIFYK